MRALTASCVAALVLTCGAGAAPPPPGLRHAELMARADRICERYATLLQHPTGGTGTLGEPAYDAAWLRLFVRQRRELSDLRPGRRDAAGYRRFLVSLPVIEKAAGDLMSVLERRGGARASRGLLRRFLAAQTESTRRARAVGLRRCPSA
jgi:hypothetical protein